MKGKERRSQVWRDRLNVSGCVTALYKEAEPGPGPAGMFRDIVMAKPTLHTVAAHAGVSIATVSKVVNGVRQGISEATLEKVQASVRLLGYRPNRAGRGLRTLRRSIVGMAIVDPSPTFLADPFTTQLVAGLSNHLSDRGFGLLLHGIKPGQVRESFLVKESVVDGLCLLLSGPVGQRQEKARMFADLGQPIVVFQETPIDGLADACFIGQDDAAGAEALADLVLKRQPKTALIVIPETVWPAIDIRLRTLLKALAGVATTVLRCDESDPDAIAGAIAAHIEGQGLPDVLLGGNDRIASVALRQLRVRGVRVPEDVGVTGFNAFPSSDYAGLNLTTVRSAAYALGELGGQQMLERLQSGRFDAARHTLAVELVPGGTL